MSVGWVSRNIHFSAVNGCPDNSSITVFCFIKDISFVQTASASNQTKTIEVDGGGLQGNTYSSSSFYTENLRADNNGQRLCLNGDCSARIDIGSLNQGVATNDVIATSLDLRPFIKKGNLIWTTRDATGYTYKEIE